MSILIYRLTALAGFTFLGAAVPYWCGFDISHWLTVGGAGLGAIFGATHGSRLLTALRQTIRTRLDDINPNGMIAGGAGLLFGLAAAALGLFILRQLVGRSNMAWEMLGVLGLVSGAMRMAVEKQNELVKVIKPNQAADDDNGHPAEAAAPAKISCKVLDTSAIIDGRIADICKTGFLEGTLLVPGFVLGELQRIADSSDTLKRNRGRRGLDILNRMQKEGTVDIRICDHDFEDLNDVDTKILRLARLVDAKVVTNDFNLNKVAELYGVPVLNINELSNAIKPVVLPGEEMFVHIIKDGKEFGQGIGYLEDGTMVVVDGGRQHIGEDLDVMVTSVLQTAAGRMIFGKPKEMARPAMAQNQ